jgi:hypothetical protein
MEPTVARAAPPDNLYSATGTAAGATVPAASTCGVPSSARITGRLAFATHLGS